MARAPEEGEVLVGAGERPEEVEQRLGHRADGPGATPPPRSSAVTPLQADTLAANTEARRN